MDLLNEILEKGIGKESQNFVVFSENRELSKNILADLSAKISCLTMFAVKQGNCIELSNKTNILFREEAWKKTPSFKYQTWDEVFYNNDLQLQG
jgi:hypothetical protein